ncbi:MAG: hypothetical protein V1872_04195 [bacterium]
MARIGKSLEGDEIIVRVNSDIGRLFQINGGYSLKTLEQEIKKRITVRNDDNLHKEQYDIMSF